MSVNKKKVFQKLLVAWGMDSILDKTQEECGELIHAIAKNRYKNRRAYVVEEAAHVKLMVERLIAALEAEEEVEREIEQKLAKWLARVEQSFRSEK